MGHVVQVAHHQLHRVLTGRQVQGHLSLAPTKVDVIVISRQAIFQLALFALTKGRTVQQQVVVACVFLFGPGGGNAHAFEPKDDGDRGGHCCAILKIDEIDSGPFGRGRVLSQGGTGHHHNRDKGRYKRFHFQFPPICVRLPDSNTQRAAPIRTTSQNSVSEVRDGMAEVFPRLWRYAVSLTGRRDWGDDLAQTTCLRALDKADQFEAGTHLDRWMFRMAQRIWLNELRSRKVRTGGGLVPVEEIDLPDKSPDAEVNIFARDVLNKVNALPEAQRQSVVLVYVEGYSYKEAAEIMEIPIGTVMSRLASARKRLNTQMADTQGQGHST